MPLPPRHHVSLAEGELTKYMKDQLGALRIEAVKVTDKIYPHVTKHVFTPIMLRVWDHSGGTHNMSLVARVLVEPGVALHLAAALKKRIEGSDTFKKMMIFTVEINEYMSDD